MIVKLLCFFVLDTNELYTAKRGAFGVWDHA